MKKRFIEWDLPLAEISEESAREKYVRKGHLSTLHVWWARRPLASSRATNFAALIDLPNDENKRRELTELIRKMALWEAVENGNDSYITKAQELIKDQWGKNLPVVLDPFSGGGSIPLEALRLGCKTYANDYNPVAIFIEKATLDWPLKFGIEVSHPDKKPGIDGNVEKINILTYMLNKWAKIILKDTEEEIGKFYDSIYCQEQTRSINNKEKNDGWMPLYFLWARVIKCQNPSCNAEIPLIPQFWLCTKKGRKVAYHLIIDQDKKSYSVEILKGDKLENVITQGYDPSNGTISGGDASCPFCNQITTGKQIRKIAWKKEMKESILVVSFYHLHKGGKVYRKVEERDIDLFEKSKIKYQEKINNTKSIECPIPDEPISTPNNIEYVPGSLYYNFTPVVLYGMTKWGDLFNTRQKLALMTFVENINKSYNEILTDCKNTINSLGESVNIDSDEFANSIMGYLSLAFNRTTTRNSNLCVLHRGSEGVEKIFALQALPMKWEYPESNIFQDKTVAGFIQNVSSITEAIHVLSSTSENNRITISQHSAIQLPWNDNSIDAIFTDPPYYDNVPYAALSDFFYVWLKRIVGDIFPEIFTTPKTPKREEVIAELPLLRGMKKEQASVEVKNIKTAEHFENLLEKSFKEIYRILKPNGIATIVYAHKTTEGWETLLNSLIRAELVVTASWPIHTEMKSRLRAVASAALASSIYIVCRKVERQKVGFFSELQPKIKDRVEYKLQQFWNEGIAGGDFFISAIGPGMEIFSQYERVEKLSGDQVSTVELLDFIRTVSTDFIVRKLLKDTSSANIDNESDFYLAFRWTYLDNTVEYDDARKLANASGVSLEKLWSSGGFVKKNGSKISVMGPKERDKIDSTHNMVDVMHKCLQLWEIGEKEKLTQLLAKTGFGKDPAFKQFCQAIAESLLNGNKEKQLLEGFLIGIDSYQKAKVKIGKDQTDLSQYGGV